MGQSTQAELAAGTSTGISVPSADLAKISIEIHNQQLIQPNKLPMTQHGEHTYAANKVGDALLPSRRLRNVLAGRLTGARGME
jgi:hypothetical protein